MNVLRRASLWVTLAAGSILPGCQKEAAPKPPPPPPVAVVRPPPPAEPRASPLCAAPLNATPVETLQIGSRTAQRVGSTLRFEEKDADGQLVLGALGPINEDSGRNLVALRKYLQFFKTEKVDAVVVTGDSGEVAEAIARVLTELGSLGVPVLTIAGNRECSDVYVDGLALAKEKVPQLVNMHEYRVVSFPEGSLVSLPGYHDPNFITCANGCRYFKSTVDEVIEAAKGAQNKPVVLVAHGPPHGEGSQALDFASSAGNVGDPEVNRALHEGAIPFGLFSNIKESGGRATDAAGSTLIPQGSPVSSLYLALGPADTTPWVMNDRSPSQGFAATLTLKEGQGRWKLFRAPPPNAADKAEAKKLDPEGRAPVPPSKRGVNAPAPGTKKP